MNINPRKILVVEDNLADFQLAKIAFKKSSYKGEIIHFLDGEQLFHFLNLNTLSDIDFILLDFNIPKISGIEVLKIMHKDEIYKNIPIIIFSSSKREFDVNICYEFGANAYVCKPADLDAFQKSINAIVGFWTSVNVLPNFKERSASLNN